MAYWFFLGKKHMFFSREVWAYEHLLNRQCKIPMISAFISGWWYTYPSEKYEFVSWDDDIPNIWKVIKFHGSKPPTRYPMISPFSLVQIENVSVTS